MTITMERPATANRKDTETRATLVLGVIEKNLSNNIDQHKAMAATDQLVLDTCRDVLQAKHGNEYIVRPWEQFSKGFSKGLSELDQNDHGNPNPGNSGNPGNTP